MITSNSNSALQSIINYILKYIKIFDQINAALASMRDFFNNKKKYIYIYWLVIMLWIPSAHKKHPWHEDFRGCKTTPSSSASWHFGGR